MKTLSIGLLFLFFILNFGWPQAQAFSSKKPKGDIVYKNERAQTLPNGLKVYFIPDDSLPRVGLQLLIPVGTVNESSELAGVNSLTASLLDQGTQNKKALEIADLFADAGSDFSVDAGYDFTILSSSALTTQFEPVLNLFTEVVFHPTFPKNDFQRLRRQSLVQLQGLKDRSGPWANHLMMETFYKDTAYGRNPIGKEESLKNLSRQKVFDFYKAHYKPKGSILAISGRIDKDMETKVIQAFSAWSGDGEIPKGTLNLSQLPEGGRMKIETPHDAQTEIRLIQKGVPRTDADYLKLRLANEILGGSFVSRLNQKVRDDLGLTYSIYSYLDTRNQAGSWVVSTFSKNESAEKTIEETVQVLNEYAKTGATQKELDSAKNLVKSQFPRALETADKLAYNLLVLDFYGIGAEYLVNFNKNIDSYSLSDINKVIKEHLRPKDMLIMSFN